MTKSQVGFFDFMLTVLDALAVADVEYLIGGSVAVWAWGENRTTNDFDLVVDLPFERVYALSKALETRNMLVPPEVIVDLLMQPEGDLPINAIHMDSGFKAELFVLRPGDNFRANALARRTLVDMGPPLGEVYVHTPEDLILNKIRYFSLSYQTKHLRDIASMFAYSYAEIDRDYIQKWVNDLGLAETWRDMQPRIQAILDGNE